MGTDLLGEEDKTYATQAFISKKKVKDVDRELKIKLNKGSYGEEIDEKYLTKEYFDKHIGANYKLTSEILRELKAHKKESIFRFNSLDSANEEIVRLQRKLNKKTNKIEELNNKVGTLETGMEEVRGLLRGDDISSKRVNSIYNFEMALSVVILVSTAIFYKVLGLMAIPMIIIGLGIFFTSFMLKSKVKEMRKEYGI